MIYSQACGYCLTALCRLRLMSSGGPIRVAELCRVKGAEQDDLPAMFVAKIFQDLVRGGILSSVRGRSGGFTFARPPAKIRISDIVDAVDGVGGCRMCISGMPLCNEQQPCPLHERFLPIRKEILRFLQETTLEDLSESLAAKMNSLGLSLSGCGGVCTPEAGAPETGADTGASAAGKKSVSLKQVPVKLAVPKGRARKA